MKTDGNSYFLKFYVIKRKRIFNKLNTKGITRLNLNTLNYSLIKELKNLKNNSYFFFP